MLRFLFFTGIRNITDLFHSQVLETFCKDWIVNITDITDLVKQLKRDYDTGGADNLQTPSERIYQVRDQNVASQIGLLENE